MQSTLCIHIKLQQLSKPNAVCFAKKHQAHQINYCGVYSLGQCEEGIVRHGRVWGLKLCIFLLHSYINLCSWLYNHFCTLLWSMQASPFPYYELNTSNTKIIQNKKLNFLHNKLCIHTIIM
jgi:hypothetical protein